MKFLFNVFYVIVIFDKKSLNRSRSTSSLYTFRITFDMCLLFLVLTLSKLFFTPSSDLMLGKMWYFIFGSRIVMEIVIYFMCVKLAYRRSVY